jgi:lipid-A-disaccharide synthase
MRVFIVAGDPSGDHHAAALAAALQDMAGGEAVVIEGVGGSACASAGVELLHDLASRGLMGFVEVVKHFPEIRRVYHSVLNRWATHRPDVVVLVDYPGFNLRLAKQAHKMNIPVVYYISPQVWAWKPGRISYLTKYVDTLLVIFPFEEAFFRPYPIRCRYVGHPLAERIHTWRTAHDPVRIREQLNLPEGRLPIALLPGSRLQEIKRIFPTLCEAAKYLQEQIPNAYFLTSCLTPAMETHLRNLSRHVEVAIHVNAMYEVLSVSALALVASGTATLETALFEVPHVIVYKVHPLTYQLAKRFVRVPSIGIVNLLLGRTVIPEFIQGRAQPRAIAEKALSLLRDTPERAAMLAGFAEVQRALRTQNVAARAAEEVLAVVQRRKGHA